MTKFVLIIALLGVFLSKAALSCQVDPVSPYIVDISLDDSKLPTSIKIVELDGSFSPEWHLKNSSKDPLYLLIQQKNKVPSLADSDSFVIGAKFTKAGDTSYGQNAINSCNRRGKLNTLCLSDTFFQYRLGIKVREYQQRSDDEIVELPVPRPQKAIIYLSHARNIYQVPLTVQLFKNSKYVSYEKKKQDFSEYIAKRIKTATKDLENSKISFYIGLIILLLILNSAGSLLHARKALWSYKKALFSTTVLCVIDVVVLAFLLPLDLYDPTPLLLIPLLLMKNLFFIRKWLIFFMIIVAFLIYVVLSINFVTNATEYAQARFEQIKPCY